MRPINGKPHVSLRDFSRHAGVSASTVSRTFTKPDLVAADTRERVLELARRTGFRPSPVTRAAVGKSTFSVGVLLPTLRVAFFADLALGIQQVLLKAGYLPVLLSQNGSDIAGVRRLIDHRVDALIFGLCSEVIRQDLLEAVTGENFPFVLVDQPHPGLSYDCVLNDDENGGYQAGRHLAEHGHRRVGAVHYGEGKSNCEARIAGCRRALHESGGQLKAEDIICVLPHKPPEEQQRSLHESIELVLRRSDRPTAIFSTSDPFALEVMSVARRLGLRIPADLSIVGFADLPFAEMVDPPLTSIRQNGQALGRVAAELVLSRLAEPGRELQRVSIPTRLVVRSSSGRVPEQPLVSGECDGVLRGVGQLA